MKNSNIEKSKILNCKSTNLLRSRIGPWANRNSSRWNEPFGQWIEELIQRYYDRCNAGQISYEEFLSDCVFFQTITFDRKAIRERMVELGLSAKNYEIEWDDFHRIFCRVARHLFGRNWSRSKFENDLPMAIAGLDFDGTRYSRTLDGAATNAHFHVIWAVRPQDASSFFALVNGLKFRKKFLDLLHIDDMRLDAYDASKSNVRNLATYAGKAFNRTGLNPIDADGLRIYPNSNYSGKPYKLLHNYQTRDREFLKVRNAAWNEWMKENYIPSMNVADKEVPDLVELMS